MSGFDMMPTKDNGLVLNAAPETVGRLVIIQVFNRIGAEEIDPESLEKHVGHLAAYRWHKTRFEFLIEGATWVAVRHDRQYVEIFLHDKWS